MTHDFFDQTQVSALLHGEHQTTLAALADLDRFAGQRTPPTLDEPTRAFLLHLDRVIEEDVTAHFAFEETHIFPRLSEAGAAFMVEMLQAEHDDIRPLAGRVRQAMVVFLECGGIAPASWKTFRTDAQSLVAQETFHVQKEEMGLLAAISQILGEAEDATIAAAHPKRKDA
ncbi:MAG: hemerythrin domain-containing protein [Rhodospirillum sp.]|nr:hemerythrin domain-containing protein [Rhodospirillum sp.]MCF8488378.1 hemerythrin domain-containing protein [Rhodospirillum sp.]MCF8500612.1 hemerythrin domain-containing protein [Rhodospirillum sp.]